jgi:ATP-dependent Lhr-like helicase
VRPLSALEPPLELPAHLSESWTADDALVEVLRGRLEILGPVTVAQLAASIGLATSAIDTALARLEGEGFALRGRFTPGVEAVEWCERRLLARIHRRTLHRLRAEIEPVPNEAFLRFLFVWQHVTDDQRKAGPRGLEDVVAQLEGFEVAAGSWEIDVLPDRVEDYESAWLDALGSAGKVVWQRRTLPAPRPQGWPSEPGEALDPSDPLRNGSFGERGPGKAGPVRSTPVALLRRGNLPLWRRFAGSEQEALARLSSSARDTLRFLSANGPSFLDDLARGTGLLHTQLEGVLGELAAQGLVYSDSFLGLRALLLPSERRRPIGGGRSVQGRGGMGARRRTADFGLEDAGRWVALVTMRDETAAAPADGPAEQPRLSDDDLEEIARLLLRRWGVVFRRLTDREGTLPPWRDLLRVLRRLEARGEIRGGRFVHGWSGEQYALPEAVSALRKHRRAQENAEWVAVSGTDPLNLVGILTPGARVPAIASNRVLYRGGSPAAVLLGREVVPLEPLTDAELWEARKRLERRAPAAKPALAV